MVMKGENQDLSQDTLELILSKVPLKSRTRFKCVSKAWNVSITHLRRTHPPTTNSGLVFSYRNPSKNPTSSCYLLNLLEIVEEETQRHTSLAHNLPWLIDSCNGLLLFCVIDGVSLSYHVSNPFKNQWLKLPIGCGHGHDFSSLASASLAFDGVRQYFNVICQFWDEADIDNGVLKYQIFSSESWEWREFNAKLPNSELLLRGDFNRDEHCRPTLYFKGKLYWIWSINLLVFNEKKQSFELIELPKSKQSLFYGKRLWESDDRLHYCYSSDVGLFCIWEYVDESSWRPKHRIRMDELVAFLTPDDDDMMISISPITVRPCAFDQDLQILYFQLPGYIVGYSFETKKVAKVYSDGAIGKNMHDNVYPFSFKSFDLHGLDR